MASIQERSARDGSKSYRVGYMHDPDGRGKRRLHWTGTVATPEGAVEMKSLFERLGPDLALATIAARTGRDTVTGPPLMREWLETHLTALAGHATGGTIKDYRGMVARTWGRFLADLPLDKIESGHVTAWIAWQRTQETDASRKRRARAMAATTPGVVVPEPVLVSRKSIANAQRFLSSVLAAAVEKGHVTTNVAKGAALPSDQEEAEMTFLTESEFTRVYQEVPAPWRPFVACLAGTGMRWSEATALRPEDFDLDAQRPAVRVKRAWKKGEVGVYLGGPKSERGKRTVTVPPSLVAELRPVVERAAPGALVFTTPGGARVHGENFRGRVWKPAVVRSGIGKEPRVHDLRHTHASWLIAAGVPLPVIQRRLGHESITTTVDRYGHLAPDAHWGAAEATEAALGGALPQLEQTPHDDPEENL